MKKTLTLLAALGLSLCAANAFAFGKTHKITVYVNNHTQDTLLLRNRFTGHWRHHQHPWYFIADHIPAGSSWHDEMVRPQQGTEYVNISLSNQKFPDDRNPTVKVVGFMADNNTDLSSPVLSELLAENYTAHFTNVVRGHHEYVTVDVFA
jgi:hypothetical protein